jgi:hypothetical protein
MVFAMATATRLTVFAAATVTRSMVFATATATHSMVFVTATAIMTFAVQVHLSRASRVCVEYVHLRCENSGHNRSKRRGGPNYAKSYP